MRLARVLVGTALVLKCAEAHANSLVLLQLGAESVTGPAKNKASDASGSMPLDPEAMKKHASSECDGDRDLSAWTSHESIASMVSVWQDKLPDGSIVLDDGKSTCMASTGTSRATVLSIVEEVEEEICRDNTDHHTDVPLRQFRAQKFDIAGEKMQALSETRDVLTIWPKEGTCTKETPCPVVLFFHGCGGFLPYLQFAMYDDHCFDELKSVLVFPKLRNGIATGDDESWTGDGAEVLDNFVMPLWDKFAKDNAGIIDLDRVTVMGESLGTGMALQAGLLYPDVFSAIVATGITDGTSCEKVADFQPDNVLVRATDRKASKLKLLVATFAETEGNADRRMDGLLDLVEKAGLDGKVGVHFRLFANVGHIESILMTQNQWKGLYKAIWKGQVE